MIYFYIGTLAPWIIIFCLILILLIFILKLPLIVKWSRQISWKIWLILALTVVLGSLIRFLGIPSERRVYYDEDRYLMYAVSFEKFGKAHSIVMASPDKLFIGDPDPAARVTVPVINGLSLFFSKENEQSLFITARILSILQIPLIFIVSFLIFESVPAALFAALGMALLPTPIYWSVSTNLDSYFVFFSLLSLLAAICYAKKRNIYTIALLIATIPVLLHVRLEGFLMLPTLILAIVSIRNSNKEKVLQKKDLIMILFAGIFIVIRGLASLPLFTKTWCCAEATPLEIFDLGYIFRNLIPNLTDLFTRVEFPFIITLAAFIGIFGTGEWIKKRKVSQLLIFSVWIIFYFFIYSSYYAGEFFSYTFSGSYGRFFLMLIPPFLILAGLTFENMLSYFKNAPYRKKTLVLLIFIGAFLSLIPTCLQYPQLIKISPWYSLIEQGPKEGRRFLTDVFLPHTEKNSIIIHALTAEILLSGRSTVMYDTFLSNPKAINFVRSQLKRGKTAYTLKTNTCDDYPDKCQKVARIFRFIPIALDPSNPKNFEFLKIKLK